MTLTRRTLMALTVAVTLAACAPRTEAPEPSATPPATTPPPQTPATPEAPQDGVLVLTDPAALEVDRAAREAFRLMGLSYRENRSYSVNTLASDLELPTGARWQLEDLSATSYRLRFTSDSVPGVAWFVTPEGVNARQVEANGIY